MALIEYWHDWPPVAELLRGFVGYKPLSKEARETKANGMQTIRKAFGREVSEAEYQQLPQWLRSMHATQKKS